MLGGYAAKLLTVDLAKKLVKVEGLDEALARKYIGGSGLAAKILYDETGPETDPLGPSNPLIFMTGPFTGTRVPLSGRHAVVAKSPLTGLWGESDVGGKWGVELKKAGYDGAVFRGKAEKPVYVWVCNGAVEIRDAGHVWGLDAYVLDEALKKETDGKAVVSGIGPAGERLARIAAVMTDGKDGRAAGRCGLGAVMGSKNLKAVVVRGTGRVEVADEDGLNRSVRELGPIIVKGTHSQHDHGTSGGMTTIERVGDLPVKNWTVGSWEQGAQALSGQTMAKTILTGRYYCGACIVGCGRRVRVEEPYRVDGAGPEYESLALLGANCLVDDMKAVAKAVELCNRYGLDSISTGGVIAFAFEAYERGLITNRDTVGVELTWGNAPAVVAMVEKIGKREEGLGWLLGEGVKRAAESIGGLAHEFAFHVKGLELPGHDPRAYNSVGLGYATSNRGACHLQALTHVFERSVTMPDLGYQEIQDRLGVRGKGEFTAKLQDLMSMFDSLKLCKFTLFGGLKVHHMVTLLNQVTGWDVSIEEFMKTGERIYNLKRMYNVRHGVSRKDDTLPPRFLTLKRGEGGAAENLPPLGEMLNEYYRYRGWDEFGIPTREKLKELDLPTPQAEHQA